MDQNETITIHKNRKERVDKDETISIGGSRNETVEKNEYVTVEGNQDLKVDKNQTETIHKNRSLKVKKNNKEHVSRNKSVTVNMAYATQVGAVMNTSVVLLQAEEVGGMKKTMVGKSYGITVGDKFEIIVGDSKITMTSDSISITSKKILVGAEGTNTIIGNNVEINPGGASVEGGEGGGLPPSGGVGEAAKAQGFGGEGDDYASNIVVTDQDGNIVPEEQRQNLIAGAKPISSVNDIEKDWILNNPIEAWQIGTPDMDDNDISSVALKYSVRGRAPGAENKSILSSENPDTGKSGGINTMRHVVWQALISKELGVNVAKEYGNAHENLPINTHTPKYDPNEKFDTYSAADLMVDRLNNEKGRKIGVSIDKNASRKDVVVKILDTWHKEPFYVTDKVEDSKYRVKPVSLGDSYYDAYQEVLPQLDENGNWNND